jgi:hypothetical protein
VRSVDLATPRHLLERLWVDPKKLSGLGAVEEWLELYGGKRSLVQDV